MKLNIQHATTLVAAGLVTTATTTTAFTTSTFARSPLKTGAGQQQHFVSESSSTAFFRRHANHASARYATSDEKDQEIERLKNMAAQLRAEAASLESQQRSAMAQAAERAFAKFDTNNDGEISFTELKAGLEKAFKMELSEKRVEQLMAAFDSSGDGVLQPDEMVSVDMFRNKLDALVRDEKKQASDEAKRAEEEKQRSQLMQASLELINDREPTVQEKVLSVLPYLFPLLDGLQFAGPLIYQNQENPLAIAAALLYSTYRSIPFSGFIAFFALNFLSGNPTINRLIRFNMQQAIFLDIALFFPALFGAVLGFVTSSAGVNIPPQVAEYGTDALFVTTLVSVIYASVSSLAGVTPNKLPFISNAVEKRMPTFEIMDEQGKLLSPEEREAKKKELEKKKKDKVNGDDKK